MNRIKRVLRAWFLLWGAVVLFMTPISTHASGMEDDIRLVIAYSNNIEGYVDPCG